MELSLLSTYEFQGPWRKVANFQEMQPANPGWPKPDFSGICRLSIIIRNYTADGLTGDCPRRGNRLSNQGKKIASKLEFILRSAYYALRRGYVDRSTTEVLKEYTSGWESFRKVLASANTLDSWLTIEGFDARDDWFNIDGELRHQHYNSSNFYRATLKRALDDHFSGIKSVTEYGCGVGRNLLFLKSNYPHLKCYGYELVPEGVEIARMAAGKFGVDVQYSQLDYVRDGAEKFVFPVTDVAFTVFSLEQLPAGCDIALRNMLARVNLGTIHLEPVTENYPYSPRGMIGRLDHRKTGYLRGFADAVAGQSLARVWHKRMDSSHNALMFPSIYVLKK